jgi:hypothetical protein
MRLARTGSCVTGDQAGGWFAIVVDGRVGAEVARVGDWANARVGVRCPVDPRVFNVAGGFVLELPGLMYLVLPAFELFVLVYPTFTIFVSSAPLLGFPACGSPPASSRLSLISLLATSLFPFSPSFVPSVRAICSPSPPSSCLVSGISVLVIFSMVLLASPGGMSLSPPAIPSPSAFSSAAGAEVVMGVGVDGAVTWRASVT